jgi:hypothetical protein
VCRCSSTQRCTSHLFVCKRHQCCSAIEQASSWSLCFIHSSYDFATLLYAWLYFCISV